MYDRIREVTSKGKRLTGNECIKDKDGKMLFEEEEIEKRWVEYVQCLYSDTRNEEAHTEIGNDGEPSLLDEVEDAIRIFKNGKAPGIANISTEMSKALNETNFTGMHKLSNNLQ